MRSIETHVGRDANLQTTLCIEACDVLVADGALEALLKVIADRILVGVGGGGTRLVKARINVSLTCLDVIEKGRRA